jgi:hypothetical protein
VSSINALVGRGFGKKGIRNSRLLLTERQEVHFIFWQKLLSHPLNHSFAFDFRSTAPVLNSPDFETLTTVLTAHTQQPQLQPLEV